MATLGQTNISTTLVGTTLGTSSRDVGDLCTHANVNPWSKFKPIQFNSNTGLTEQNYIDNQYGITIQVMSNVKNTQGKLWFYDKPSTYGRRLGDFRNYYHAAPVPLIQTKGTAFTVNRFASTAYAVGFSILQATVGYEDYCLTVSNMTPEGGDGVLLGNYYLACAIYNSSNSLVGTYYSHETIAYTSLNQSGSTIQLSTSPEFNSDDDVLELYSAGNYTIYLYITNYAKTAIIGVIRKLWPINYTELYPETINLTVLGLNDICNVDFIGILPTGGVWGDSSTDYLKGDIPQSVRGTFTKFDAKYVLYNLTSQKIYIPKSQVFLYYNQITTWGGAITRAYDSASYGTTNIEIEAYSSVEVLFDDIIPLPFPASVPTATGSLTLTPHVHYGNNDSGEQFYDTTSTALTLFYEE